ncbi:hypothetical protein CONPUDRAFT_138776 [Coniophora puteana RWD-64-598 SS2]|uniref:Major facilitator superfamily MFS-1 n=1 Tax=Coniophora puteana (strain RWD-64-598) TaxID=741705 RepID=A0A5M3MH37_CONPW|nr:uncharacterized protein CONPUDRAFT_138776 [Coniophora puteana RWD-64-598 SS2]EIW78548.1 hypothetical protein CONPUDRAFT_138776 [Coniophora puteana RWD-64-598 SS2]
MSSPQGSPNTPRRVFGATDLLGVDDAPDVSPDRRRVSGGGRSLRRPSFIGRWRSSISGSSDGGDGTKSIDKPPIPTAIQSSETYSTPLPTLSMTVLSITMLGEFLSANVSMPFLLLMVKGFGTLHDEAEIAFWTGILVSTFFLTQFLTSLLWATAADRHGQRNVLTLSLFGSAVTVLLFGTATTLKQAIVIRLLQGIFSGAVGVARGCVTSITDTSNEGRAYAIMGFCWGIGGVAGAIIGGSFESPAQKWPQVFEKYELFVKYPYLLPCAVAGLITLTGSFLSLFLARDGGPRGGAIQLPPEKLSPDRPEPIPEEEEEEDVLGTPDLEAMSSNQGRNNSLTGSLRRTLANRLSNYFPRTDSMQSGHSEAPSQSVPLSASPRVSRTSRADGSAYGYTGPRGRGVSGSFGFGGPRRVSVASSLRRRRGSGVEGSYTVSGSFSESAADLNFAQRLLLANENAVTNIADLWVAAAMNVDAEDPFENESDIEEDIARLRRPEDGGEPSGSFAGDDESYRDYPDVEHAAEYSDAGTARADADEATDDINSITSTPVARRTMVSPSPHLPASPRIGTRASMVTFAADPPRRASSALRRMPSATPSIFSHAGVRTPSAVLDAQARAEEGVAAIDLGPNPPFSEGAHGHGQASGSGSGSGLGGVGLGIVAGGIAAAAPGTQAARRTASGVSMVRTSTMDAIMEGGREQEAQPPSLMSQLPMLVIVQYGLLALHSTTHDQVFLSYLVSDYGSGGLNLNPGHFSQLIALMCLAQIVYQFYLYPNIGPPRGRFSHLTMFRIGSFLFIPAYVTVTMYRVFASPNNDGNFILMSALAVSRAIRYCGNTFAYTAVSILLNYMTPPHVVGFANGVAQSIVSLARCFGPIVGGYLWAASTQDNPAGYPIGFFACAAFCALAIAHSFFIR